MLAGPGDASGHPTNAARLLLPSDQGREAPWSLRPGTGKARTPSSGPPASPCFLSPPSAPPGARVPPTHIPGADVHVHELIRVLFPRGTPPSPLLPNDGLGLNFSGQEEGRGGGQPVPSASWAQTQGSGAAGPCGLDASRCGMNLPLPTGAAPSEIQETGGPTKRSPSPGSAASLLGFALLILKTDLRETGPAIPILTVFCGISTRSLPTLFWANY